MTAPKSYTSRFTNRYGEEWEFEYDPSRGEGILRGSDVNWQEYRVIEGRAAGLILNDEEIQWLRKAWMDAASGDWMPSGDPQRTWFPEMVDALRREWHEGMSIAELVRLRDRLDAMLQSIRSERKIRPPLMTCPKCGKRGPAAEPRVSVRAMILSLGRFGIASPTEARSLERAWVRYQRENGLDIYGADCSPA